MSSDSAGAWQRLVLKVPCLPLLQAVAPRGKLQSRALLPRAQRTAEMYGIHLQRLQQALRSSVFAAAARGIHARAAGASRPAQKACCCNTAAASADRQRWPWLHAVAARV
jgi:hypothetical protein